MDKIQTLSEIEDELTLKSSSEGILRDLIETQELLSSFEKLSSAKLSSYSLPLSLQDDSKRNNIDYNKSLIYKWNFEKSTNKELIDSILLSIFSGGEEGKKIAQDYAKVLIEISYTQSREETLLFLTRMEFSLSTTIKSLKDRIYEHKDIKSLKKAYSEFFEIKDKSIMPHLTLTAASSTLTSSSPSTSSEVKRSLTNYNDNCTCTCSCNSHKGDKNNSNSNGTGSTLIQFEINEEFIKTMSTLLSELINLFDEIMRSSKEITLIFQSTFNLLYAEDESLKPFIASEILKEAFAYVIYKDNFIQKMFSLIKSQDNNGLLKEKIHQIEQFEIKLAENYKEMKRLSCFIQEESLKLKKRKKPSDQIDLDDLVKYINDTQTNKNEKKDNKRNRKNNSKKSKKKQNGNRDDSNNTNANEGESNMSNNNNGNNANMYGNTNYNDRSNLNMDEVNEINAFKNCLRTTSQIKFSFHKIRPTFSKEWISSLIK